MYIVQVRSIDGYVDHSEHERYTDALSQALMVHGRVIMPDDSGLIAGMRVQIDRSGVGHCWEDAIDLSPSIVEEIETEILDGDAGFSEDYLATSGVHYRWVRG